MMPEPAPGIDPATIAAVIEANINAHLLSFARLPGAVLHDDPRCTWLDAGVASAPLNAVVSARFGPDDVDAGIEAVLGHFRRHARPFTWHVGPSSTPEDLGDSLLAHGLTLGDDEPGMALELDHIGADPAPPPGLTIETVRDERGLEEWVSVWLFPLPDDARRYLLAVLRGRGLDADLPWRFSLGRLNGVPVATSELFVGEGVASVQYVVTLPEVRRRGIGTAMTSQVLRDAHALGYKVAVLTASPDGIGSYRRLGFREFCRVRRYEWEPSEGTTGGSGPTP
jgi:ribosomal protein S18 acetylase RimI-like enzyme